MRDAFAASHEQLALNVTLEEHATLENFYPRQAAASLLAAAAESTSCAGERVNFVHGPTAVGKSHLLQGICQQLDGALYLPLLELAELPPEELLNELERAPLLAFDDVQIIAGNVNWEESFFHLMNRARQADCTLWFASQIPPGAVPIELPDLKSRLMGGVVWAIPSCDEDELGEILQFRAKRRGIELSDAVLGYMSRRQSRGLRELLDSLEVLDRASLQRQRPITVPLVKDVMGW